MGVSSSVPVDKVTDRGDTDPGSPVSITEEIPFIPRGIHVIRSAKANPTEDFLRRETCTLDRIHTGRAIRATLIKMFITSTQFHHMT